MNLKHIDPTREPYKFANAAVLSPQDPDMPCTEAALAALRSEQTRLKKLWGCKRDKLAKARLGRVEMAVATVVAGMT
jgi:hypothetical protein